MMNITIHFSQKKATTFGNGNTVTLRRFIKFNYRIVRGLNENFWIWGILFEGIIL